MTKHSAPKTSEIKDPILAKHAVLEFGFSWKWLRPRIENGQIRSKKIGRYLVLARDDIERVYGVSHAELALVRRAQAAHHSRTKKRSK